MGSPPLGRRQFLGLSGLLGAVAAGATACSAGPSAVAASHQPSTVGSGPAPTRTPTGGAPTAAARPPGRNRQGDLLHGSRSGTAIALTFHGAGDPALATAVLAELRSAAAPVTIFAVGSWLRANPSMASVILDAGHELGNHTYHHLAMSTLGAAAADQEVALCGALLKQLSGSRGRWFRPSGTPQSNATIRAAARKAGYSQCVSYDIDSLDWTDPGAAALTRRVLTLAQPGSIVSLHLGHAGTVSALPALLAGLRAKGLRPATLSELTA